MLLPVRETSPWPVAKAGAGAQYAMPRTGGIWLSADRAGGDEFHFVTVGVLDEGDHDRRVGFHRTGRSNDLCTRLFQRCAVGVDIINADSYVSVAVAEVIGLGAPVVCEFDDGAARLVGISDECEGELAVWIVFFAQQLHAENPDIKVERPVEIADTYHRVKHSRSCGRGTVCPGLGFWHRVHAVLPVSAVY